MTGDNKMIGDNKVYDVCVIGSGPAGGVLAKELAEAGAKVGLVEAGRAMKVEDFHFHAWPYELPYHGMKLPGTPPPAYPADHTRPIGSQACTNMPVTRIGALAVGSTIWKPVSLRLA